ncbi:MAG TPA: hypothetical protein EYP87_02270 [Flavobacteriaceae bacterium]|nr:hypothetical protein [Flavobacteriaceae bacterium]
MIIFKQVLILFTIVLLFFSCSSSPVKNNSNIKEDPVVIANESLGYEIIIIDIGFNLYLQTVAKPEGFYSQNYLESKNSIFVAVWNSRARNLTAFNPNVYENVIDYSPSIDYGYEVNYKLYNYFKFAEQKYKMRLR